MTNTNFAGSTVDEPVISCSNIWKVFGATNKEFETLTSEELTDEKFIKKNWTAAVRNASFDISRGEVFVIMGLSGSGKSTVVRCISRLIEPTSGGVHIEGENLLSATDEKLIDIRRQKMGMVFQHFALLPNRDVLGNVAFPLQVQGVGRKEREAKAAEMISLVGLEGREDYFPSELSGGQQQRVGIARSLASDPSIWFLDEPFSALDPLIRKEMQDEFLRLQAVLNKTIMFVTHDFDEALRLADRIAIMKDGIIEQLDTPDNIVLNPATEYVKKFTEDVPREKVLKIESIMDAYDSNNSSSTKVSKDAIIETLAESILNSKEILTVVDNNNEIVGSLNPTKVIKVIFGK